MKDQNQTPKKKKQKKTAGEILTPILLLLVGAVCGVLVVEYTGLFTEEDAGFLSLALLFLSLYVAMILQLILHEGGHLLFGLLSGYRFVSFRIFSLMLIRVDGKFRLKRFSLAGTAGQCLMSPPDMKDGRIPIVLYNLGGVIVNALTAILFLCLFLFTPALPYLSPFFLFLALFGFTFALQNGIPMRTGLVENDGRNALSLGRDASALRAFWLQLKINAEVARGLRLREMPAEWFSLPREEEMQNPLIATVAVFAAGRYMDEHRFEEAAELIDRLLARESGIIGVHRALLICDRMTLDLLFSDGTRASALLDSEQRKLMLVMKDQPSVMRTEYALACLSERDPKKAAAVRAAFDKRAKNYPYPNDLALDRELLSLVDEKCG